MARILVVEDSPTQAARLIYALEERGLEVSGAADGERALALFASEDFDVVISDVMMPGMSGYELCRAIKSHRAKPPVPVVLLTSLSEPMDVINGLECGADNFIRKPYATDDLVARVERILANIEKRNADRLSIGVNVEFMGNRYTITSERTQILDLLISTFEETVRANRELEQIRSELTAANAKIKRYADELESRVVERTRELATANEVLRSESAARQKAESQLVQAQKMEAIGTLTGGIAHDFNNLLGIVIGNLDLLRPLARSIGEADELIAASMEAALRGADLTRRLLAFARRQTLNPVQVEINALVEGTARLIDRVLGESIDVVLDLAPNVWSVEVDPAQLESSLVNLATNARDAMPKGGTLRFTTRNQRLDADYTAQYQDVAPGEYALIAVSDDGTGMPPDVVSRIFDPFFTTKEKDRGTGLGLAMVFGFMKQSHGHINVYSEVGTGTVFRLYLPRSDAAAATTHRSNSEPAAQGQGELVLVVEDNAAMRKIAGLQLRTLNYRVVEADSAMKALEILEREIVHVVLSDIILPGAYNGIDLIRTTLERWPHIGVVLSSGFADPKVLSGLGSTGNIRVLIKPYRKEDLAREVHNALQGSAG
ncbi:MAG TPA: response regulator [Stellaceae bacterium]|nr:response regulator [Stellaceae bacterium]